MGVEQIRDDFEELGDRHDTINSHLADMTGNYEEAKDFILTQYAKNAKWRKRHSKK